MDTRFFVDGIARRTTDDRKVKSFARTEPSEATLHERRVALAYERRSNRCRTPPVTDSSELIGKPR